MQAKAVVQAYLVKIKRGEIELGNIKSIHFLYYNSVAYKGNTIKLFLNINTSIYT
jgi:hypothetical protein